MGVDLEATGSKGKIRVQITPFIAEVAANATDRTADDILLNAKKQGFLRTASANVNNLRNLAKALRLSADTASSLSGENLIAPLPPRGAKSRHGRHGRC